jgi:hypothetical protein
MKLTVTDTTASGTTTISSAALIQYNIEVLYSKFHKRSRGGGGCISVIFFSRAHAFALAVVGFFDGKALFRLYQTALLHVFCLVVSA